ncbi:MAG: leucine-rich repeat protein, partial [Eubacterium sp.]|nr:leucine-rich repeat protein [Eubacterium sp.]
SVYTVNANDILTAAWTPVEYSISYDLEEGKLKKANPSVYTIETNDFTLNNPEKDGYSFDGWTGSNGESTSKEVTVAKGTTGNLEFTANWTHLYDYNADTKSLVLYSGSEETIADVMSKHPEVESIMVEADVDAGAISFPIFTSLKSITVSAGNKDYVSENGILYDANMKMLYCPAAHEDNPSVSKKCTEITEKAFKNSTVITLNIPYSVKKICSGAFENCSKLTEITIKNPNCTLEEESIPATIKTVYGFEDSSVIQYSVKNHIPYKALTTLDGEFFADEVTMTSFHVPDNITDIGRSAFVGCKNLTEISLGTVSSIGAYAFARTSISNEENGGVVSLPDTVENVAEGAFNKCDAIKKIRINSMTTEFAWSDTALTLPKTVIMECYYGSKAYEYATSHDYPISLLVGYEADNTEEYVSGDTDNLVSVSFGPIIKKIGENAFTGAEKLTEVSFDEKSVLETIGTEAFSETGLTFVSLPDSVTTLGTGVFKNSALTKLVVENPNCVFPDEGGLVPEGAVIKGYQNSSADVYSQTYYDSACEGFGKPAYVISFDMTGGKNGTEKLYVVNGDKIPSIEVPEREDYDFAGYYVQENGRGTKYFDAEGNSVKDWDSTTNITLYAAWNHQTYTVVYDGNGATEGTMENSVFDTNTEVT